jgi:hypothetical protein
MFRANLLPLVALPLVVACGTAPQTSSTQERATIDNPAHVMQADALAFENHVDQIMRSPSGTGTIAVREFLKIMPMADDQRQIILDAFMQPFDVSCGPNGICRAATSGRGAEATMDVTLNGVSDPKLKLETRVTTNLTLRQGGVEFCDVYGMWAKKFFITRQVQGIFLDTARPTLTVNVDDDSQNFTCR